MARASPPAFPSKPRSPSQARAEQTQARAASSQLTSGPPSRHRLPAARRPGTTRSPALRQLSAPGGTRRPRGELGPPPVPPAAPRTETPGQAPQPAPTGEPLQHDGRERLRAAPRLPTVCRCWRSRGGELSQPRAGAAPQQRQAPHPQQTQRPRRRHRRPGRSGVGHGPRAHQEPAARRRQRPSGRKAGKRGRVGVLLFPGRPCPLGAPVRAAAPRSGVGQSLVGSGVWYSERAVSPPSRPSVLLI